MTTQHEVDAWNKGFKTDQAVEYTFRNPEDKCLDAKIFTWEEIEDGLIRLWKRRGFVIIDRRVVELPVGTLNPPAEHEKTGGYLA